MRIHIRAIQIVPAHLKALATTPILFLRVHCLIEFLVRESLTIECIEENHYFL
jgi:hypothetical protein